MPVDNTFVDHYAVLDVSCTTTREEIEKSFRRKLLACQRGEVPDNAQAVVLTQAHLSRLEHAHDVLLDAGQRTEFDRRLALETT
jgi:curved DNA-binding protein CbpA